MVVAEFPLPSKRQVRHMIEAGGSSAEGTEMMARVVAAYAVGLVGPTEPGKNPLLGDVFFFALCVGFLAGIVLTLVLWGVFGA